MFLTTNLYRQLAEPPAHVLRINDSVAFLIGGSDGDVADGGLVLALEHTDTHDRWHQLFLMNQRAMRDLGEGLIRFADTWEQSHESQPGDA